MYQLASGVILKDANEQFLPSIFPRIAAAICVLLLIGSLAVVSVGGVALLGPMFAHGDDVAHAPGKLVAIGAGMNCMLQKATGQWLDFQCSNQCRESLGQKQRHQREHVLTNLSYIQGT